MIIPLLSRPLNYNQPVRICGCFSADSIPHNVMIFILNCTRNKCPFYHVPQIHDHSITQRGNITWWCTARFYSYII